MSRRAKKADLPAIASAKAGPVTRTYSAGKKLFGKHAGSFVFRRKAKTNKADQLKLRL